MLIGEGGPSTTAAPAASPGDLLPTPSELPPGFRAPQASEGGDAALILHNRSNPYVGPDDASAWYHLEGDPPSIFVTVERVHDLATALPRMRVCAQDVVGDRVPGRFLATPNAVAHYMLRGDDRGPIAQPEEGSPPPPPQPWPPQEPAFQRMMDLIANRTSAKEACSLQRSLLPSGWEEPNEDRTQARQVQGYYDGLRVGAGDQDWFQASLPKAALGHVGVVGEGVSATVEYANGTMVQPGIGGWWFDTERPEDTRIFVRVTGTGTYTLLMSTLSP